MDPASYQYQVPYYPPQISVGVDTGGDRFPQWSIQETRDFLVIRAELDPKFMDSKRNKPLWDVISTKMKTLGYNRSPDQCKSKWKNLVTRYKGCETMEGEGQRQQFPFYDELQAIFGSRMQRMMWMEAEEGGSGSKQPITQLLSDEDDEDEDSHHESGDKRGGKRKKKKKAKSTSTDGNNNNTVKEILENFMKQQMEMEMRWMKVMEQREEERRRREMEWRQRMEALENERIVMENKWREKEEEWRTREEARAERRDALINTLLTKLSEDHS